MSLRGVFFAEAIPCQKRDCFAIARSDLLFRVMGNKTKPDIVIEVIRHVPVAIRTADVPSIIVPGAAAIPSRPNETGS